MFAVAGLRFVVGSAATTREDTTGIGSCTNVKNRGVFPIWRDVRNVGGSRN